VTPRQFADLAAAIALHSEELSTAGGPNSEALHRVWKRTVECCQAWRAELQRAPSPFLYAEFFAAELPLRVWCAAVAEGKSRGESHGAAVAAKINGELLAFRCLMLQALSADVGLSKSEAAAVDRFRRRCERWCDMLLGPVVFRTGAADSTFQPDRAFEFGERFTGNLAGKASWQLMMAGLRLSFTEAESFRSASHPKGTARAAALVGAIFASLPPAAFLSSGTLRDPTIGRLSRTTQETAPKKRSRKPSKPSVAAPALQEPQPSHGPPLHTHSPISFSRLRKGTPKQN
jgi:hypothetical protein